MEMLKEDISRGHENMQRTHKRACYLQAFVLPHKMLSGSSDTKVPAPVAICNLSFTARRDNSIWHNVAIKLLNRKHTAFNMCCMCGAWVWIASHSEGRSTHTWEAKQCWGHELWQLLTSTGGLGRQQCQRLTADNRIKGWDGRITPTIHFKQ